MWRERLRQLAGPLLAALLLAGAVWVLTHELRQYKLHDILHAAGQIPRWQVLLAALFTLCSYTALSFYDRLAFEYVGQHLPYPKIALASFVGYAFSQNLGFPLVTGSAVRYRLYAGWGLSAIDVAKVVALCTITFWLGFASLSGVAFVIAPPYVPGYATLSIGAIRTLGVVFLLLLAAYLYWCASHRTLRIRGWQIQTPPIGLSLVQIGVSCADWCAVAAVLYVLLPGGVTLSFGAFLTMFLLAQVIGIVSNVPGGLGVFESAMLLLLHGQADTPTLVGSLLIYRIAYFLCPLGLAMLLLGSYEASRKRVALARFAGVLGEWIGPLVPQIFAVTMFVGGTILLFSGATPTAHDRAHWLRDVLPIAVVELSHFAGSLAGAALLLVARGLQRRVDAAYWTTIFLLVVGIFASLLKGFDYEEAIALTVMLLALIPSHRHFDRRSALVRQRFTTGWIIAILLVIAGSVWLGMFSYKHVEFTNDLWWHFSFGRAGDAPRFLRASVGIAALFALLGLWRLMRPSPPEPTLPTSDELDRAARILERVPETYGNFALLGDKELLFSDSGNAFLMYGIQGRSWIGLGEPVGDPSEYNELAWRLLEMADQHGGWTVVHHVSAERLPLYVQMGLTAVKIGENARVPLAEFSLDGRSRKQFRQAAHKFERDGCTFDVVPPQQVADLLPRLRQVSDAWLDAKHTREKRFAIGFFDEGYIARYPVALVRREDEILAFANVWRGAPGGELSVDLMRFRPETPHGVMDYLFSQLMVWGRSEGYAWFDLGMAPLAGLEHHPLAPLWHRVGNLVFRHGEYFFNYQGLREYKDKFEPIWSERYLVYPGGLILANILIDLATLISGGVRGIVTR